VLREGGALAEPAGAPRPAFPTPLGLAALLLVALATAGWAATGAARGGACVERASEPTFGAPIGRIAGRGRPG
jgi:hypothetical protein